MISLTAVAFAPAVSAAVVTPGDNSKATTTTEVVTNKKISPMLRIDSARAARIAVDKYAEIVANGGWPKVPRGNYSRNKKSDNTTVLNRRLYLEGYLSEQAVSGDQANVFSVLTEQAVARYQRNMGLAVTGKVDGATLAQLNIPAGTRLRTLEANVARIEIYSENLGDRYLLVNIPSSHIEAVSGGRMYSKHNAIVGRPERPTPVVMTPLTQVRFNPYWHAPASIVERDILPRMNNGTRVLEEMNVKVFKGGNLDEEIDPSDVDWSTAVPDDYLFRQEPGPTNAMATAKIEFSSPFGIYLHDTPEKNLFKSGRRFFSSGCVRVQNMPLLVNWVLNGQDGYGPDQISAMEETLERKDVKLAAPPQLRVTYLTAWPLADGTVSFRDDIYQLDQTGFTVGQPLPPGEVSEEGLRYVLKPVPRLLAQVDAAEAEGVGIFSGRKLSPLKPGQTPPKRKPVVNADDAGDDDIQANIFNKKSSKKIVAAVEPEFEDEKTAKTLLHKKTLIGSKEPDPAKPANLFGAERKPQVNKPVLKQTLFTTRTERTPRKQAFSLFKPRTAEKGKKAFVATNFGAVPAERSKPVKFKAKPSVAGEKPVASCLILNGVPQAGCKAVKKTPRVKTVKLKIKAKPAAATIN